MRRANTNIARAWLVLALSAALVNCSSDGGGESSGSGTGGTDGSSGSGSSLTEGSGGTGGGFSNTGGSAGSTGGTVSNTGGTVSNTGGTVSNTGGTVSNTGGTTGTTGGMSGITGGRFGTGGRAGTGGTTGSTGGVSGETGGTSSTTGGTTSETGGTTGSTGGTGEVVAGDFTVTVQLASEVQATAPGTIGIVQWSMVGGETIEEAHIEFGLDTSYGMVAPVDLTEAGFRTLLLGMKPNSDYHFRVVAKTVGGTFSSADNTVRTGGATNLVTLDDFNPINDAARERGFIISELFQSGMSMGNSGAIAFVIDPDGEIVWWYQSSTLTSLARARMSADGKNMWLIASGLNGAAIERVTMDTLESQIYDVVGSHDITPVAGSKMAYLDYGGNDCDNIVEIDPSGTTTDIFESSNVSSGQCHSNSLRYSATEDVYTFSDHTIDVYVVNRSGQVDWKLSDRVGPNTTWGGQQHGVHLLDDSIIIFANQGDGSNASMIEYALDGTERMRYNGGVRTSNLGDVQRLPGGNTLVTYSTSTEIHEIDASGNAVLTIDTGSTIGYSEWRTTLYGAPTDLGL